MYKIPKVINFHHSGPLSYLRYLSIESAARLNPEYKIKFYYSLANNVKFATGEHPEYYTGPDYTQKLSYLVNVETHPIDCNLPTVQLSDFLRWQFLSTGGIWSDDDIIYFSPVDKFIPDCSFACYEVPPHGWTIGLMAAAPGCEIVIDIIRARNNLTTKRYQGFGAELLASIAPTHAAMAKKYPDEIVYNFPRRTIFVEIGDQNCKNLYVPGAYKPDTLAGMLGLHWYGGQPGALKIQDKIPANSIIDYAVQKYRSLL